MAMSTPIGIRAAFLEALKTKSGLAAASMLGFLLLLAVLVPIIAPYDVVNSWNNPTVWADNPKLVPPEWSERFVGKHLPRTIIIPPDGEQILLFDDTPSLRVPDVNKFGPSDVITYSLAFPTFKDPSYEVFANIKSWLISKNVTNDTEWQSLYPSPTGFYSNPPRAQVLLLADLNHSMLDPTTAQVLKGPYTIRFVVNGFSSIDDANARAVIYGTVFGLVGTDDQRHDLTVALLWGAPVALAFGLVGALASVLIQTLLGAISGWYGGVIDE